MLVIYKHVKYRRTEDATLQGACEVVLLLNNTKYFKGVKFMLCVTDGFNL